MKKNIFRIMVMVVSIGLIWLLSCETEKIMQPEQPQTESITSLEKSSSNTGGLEEARPGWFLKGWNQKLESAGKNFRIMLAEWITAPGSDQVGRTVYFSNFGNKQLSSHWVPGDPQRDGRTNITWLTDQTELTSDLSSGQTNIAIDDAMATWNNASCSTIPLEKIPDYNMNWGYVQYLLGYGGFPGWMADITHAGWLPGSFFDQLASGGSTYIIGVTFTFIWVDANGNPTDMDHNKKNDVAFREIYYNDYFQWGINMIELIDVESIVLHETGHGLSQAHFGKLFMTDENGKYHFAPRAVMNAGYTGIQQNLTATDLAGHCSIWASWPNN